MLTGQHEWSRRRLGCGLLEMTASEFCVLVLAALGWNALGFGAFFLANGTITVWTVGLVVGGAVSALAATGWLVIVYQVREIVGTTA